MRSRFAMLLAIAVVCVTTAWAAWTPEALVTGGSTLHSVGGNNGHKLVFGPDGVGHLVWTGEGGGLLVAGIWCNRYDPLSGWGADFQVNPRGSSPAIALDADGTTLHLVWMDTSYAGVCYQKCTRQPDGSDLWGPVVPLRQLQSATYPAIASVPNDPNHVVVCWEEEYSGRPRGYKAIGFIECINGQWGTPMKLDSASGGHFPSIAAVPNGDVYVAYSSSVRHVFVKTRHNGVWGTTVDVTSGLGTDQCSSPAIEVNPVTGNPHVVLSWMRIIQINKKLKDTLYAAYHTYRNSQGAWLSVPELISGIRNRARYGFPDQYPTMAFIDNGAAYAVWEEPGPVPGRGAQYSYNSAEGGTWTSPAWLNSDTAADYRSGHPHVAYCGTAQTVHVVWSRCFDSLRGKPLEIWSTSNYLGGGGPPAQPSAISQSRVELFPNPAKAGRVTVQYSLPRAGQMTVTLLDVSGRAVGTQEVAASGPNGTFSIDASGLNAGVYIVKLESGTTSQTRKLVIR